MSVVGFDGPDPRHWLSHELTTVRQPTAAMVAAAIDMLAARMDDPNSSTKTRVISGELVAGATVRLG